MQIKGLLLNSIPIRHRTSSWYQSGYIYPTLEESIYKDIDKNSSDQEIQKVVFEMEPWKALGLDNHPIGFYHHHTWNIIGKNTSNFIKHVWNNTYCIADINNTNICLILKVSNPQHVHQFPPLSLCN